MLNRTRVFGVLLLVLVVTVTAYPDQPRMTAARADHDLPFAARAQSLLAAASVHDAAAFDLRPASVAAAYWMRKAYRCDSNAMVQVLSATGLWPL